MDVQNLRKVLRTPLQYAELSSLLIDTQIRGFCKSRDVIIFLVDRRSC
jgi:hypothetical protein